MQLPPAGPPSTGGEYLGELIAKVDALRSALGFARWADLAYLCNGADPKTLNKGELVVLLIDLRRMLIERQAQL